MKRTLKFCLMAIFSLTLLLPCRGPLKGITFAFENLPIPARTDLSDRNWTESFKLAHSKLAREYPFTEWKGVDWDALYENFLPRIEEASAARDERAFYLALHEYVFSIPDGNVGIEAEDTAILTSITHEEAGGGYGMVLAELDDFRVIAAAVIPGCQAEEACIEPGAEIITWDGMPVREAIDKIDVGSTPHQTLTGEETYGKASSISTSEHYRLVQTSLLARAPIGKRVTVMFKNPGSENLQTAFLTASEDGGATLGIMCLASRPAYPDGTDHWIMPEGYGYLLIRDEESFGNRYDHSSRIMGTASEAIRTFLDSDVKGMILDLRGNSSSLYELAGDLCGFFYPEEIRPEYIEIFDSAEGSFLRIEGFSIKPQAVQFDRPVVVLINPGTKGAGEWLAKHVSRSINGHSVGFHATNGSFGPAGGEILLPLGYKIQYPLGRSLDRNGTIQIDSRNRSGGVTPIYRVPKTLHNMLDLAEGTDVEMGYAVNYLRWIGNW